jgi:pimeloyl-ACP methyl ester carboxylesterase
MRGRTISRLISARRAVGTQQLAVTGTAIGHTHSCGRNRLADAQLAIVPGTSHSLPMEKPDVVNRLILDFLADSQTPKMF